MKWFSSARLWFWVGTLFNAFLTWLAAIVIFILLFAFLTGSPSLSVLLALIFGTLTGAAVIALAYRRTRPVLLYLSARNLATAQRMLAGVKQFVRWDRYFVEVYSRESGDCLLRPKGRRSKSTTYGARDVRAMIDDEGPGGAYELIVACPAHLRDHVVSASRSQLPKRAATSKPAAAAG